MSMPGFEGVETVPQKLFGTEFAAAVGNVSLSGVIIPGKRPGTMPPIDQYQLVPIGPQPSWWSPSAALGYQGDMPSWVTVEKYEYDASAGSSVAWPDIHVDGHAGVGITYRAAENGRSDDVLIAVGSVVDPRQLQPDSEPIKSAPPLLEVVQLQGVVRDEEQPELTHGLHAINWQGTLLEAIEAASNQLGVDALRVNPTIPHGDAATTGRIRSTYARAARQRAFRPDPNTNLWVKSLNRGASRAPSPSSPPQPRQSRIR